MWEGYITATRPPVTHKRLAIVPSLRPAASWVGCQYEPHALSGHMNLEAAVVANCLGNLLSALILLLGYLLFELWRDYIAIICSAFLLSQALARVTHKAVRALKAARLPSSPPLLRQLAGFAAEEARHGRLGGVPPLMLLAGLLMLLLLDDISSVGVILAGLAVYGVVAAALLWLLDKRLLGYEAVVSDESLVAMVSRCCC